MGKIFFMDNRSRFFLLILTTLLLVQCANEPKESKASNVEEFSQNKELPVQLICEENSDSSGIKTLFLLFKDNKVSLNAIPVCQPISKKRWDDLGIPKEALIAVGGKWSSGSAFHYVMMDSSQVSVYQLVSDELDGEVSGSEEIYVTDF